MNLRNVIAEVTHASAIPKMADRSADDKREAERDCQPQIILHLPELEPVSPPFLANEQHFC